MKSKSNPFLFASLGAFAALVHVAFAGDVFKANNGDALNLTSSWSGEVAPTSTDVAAWNSTATQNLVTSSPTTLASGDQTWRVASGRNFASPPALLK